MELKQLHQVILFLATTDTFEVEDLAKVVVVAVGNVNEVCLDKGLRWRRPDLQGFEESFDLEKAAVHTLDKACRSRRGKERRETALESVRVKEHLDKM